MDLFSFICHSDPTKVLIKERNVADREVKLLTMTEGRVVLLVPPASAASGGSNDSIDKLFDDGNDAEPEHPTVGDVDVLVETIAKDVLEVVEKTKKSKRKRKTTGEASVSTFPPKKLREDYHAATSNIDGKSLATIRSLIMEGSSVSSEVEESRDDGPTDSVSGLNLRARSPSIRYVVSSDDSYHSNSRFEVNSFARFPVADAPVMTVSVTTNVAADVFVVSVSKDRVRSENLENFGDSASADLDPEALHRIYVPKWKVTNDSVLDDPYVCVPWTMIGYILNLMSGSTANVPWGGKKDAEIVDLKSLLSLKEAEAAEAIHFRGQLSVAEAADAAKGNKLKGLKEKNLALEEEKSVLFEKVTNLESVTVAKETELASLYGQVAKLTSNLSSFQLSSLESAFELFKGRMEAMQDEQIKVRGNRVAELDAQLLEMAAHLKEEFYPRFLTTISGRRWILTHDGLKAGVDHGQAKRDLSMIEAYDPSAEAKTLDEIPRAKELQPSLEQLMLPKAEDDVVLGETSLSFSLQVVHSRVQRVKGEIMEKRLSLTDVMVPLAEPLSSKSLISEASTSAISASVGPITTLSTTFASFDVVLPLSVSDYQVLDMEPHNEDPPVVTFEEEEIDTTPE
nr:hypothetical protein [Tanacetum cinerariifolium]